MKIKKMQSLLFSFFLVFTIECGEFTSPSQKEINSNTIEKIKHNLRGKGVGLDYKELFDKAIGEEKTGFTGYHGDTLRFLIYQDIIRVVVEEVLEIPVRKDFHFFSSPITHLDSVQNLEALSHEFVKGVFYSRKLLENTFPLNFSIYSNHNRFGLNSVLNFTKNTGDEDLRYLSDLKKTFTALEIDLAVLDEIYDLSHQYLDVNSGVLLQVFDGSATPYEFINQFGYPSYPNGFISENQQISDYFLELNLNEYPHELRVLLSVDGVLSPTSPLIVKRYTKIQPSKLKAWDLKLREVIQSVSFDLQKRDLLKKELKSKWNIL